MNLLKCVLVNLDRLDRWWHTFLVKKRKEKNPKQFHQCENVFQVLSVSTLRGLLQTEIDMSNHMQANGLSKMLDLHTLISYEYSMLRLSIWMLPRGCVLIMFPRKRAWLTPTPCWGDCTSAGLEAPLCPSGGAGWCSGEVGGLGHSAHTAAPVTRSHRVSKNR